MTYHEAFFKAGAIIDQINDLIYQINATKYGVTDFDLALDMRSDQYDGDGECPSPASDEIEAIKAECIKNAQADEMVETLKQEYFDLTGVWPHYNGNFDWYDRSYHEKFNVD